MSHYQLFAHYVFTIYWLFTNYLPTVCSLVASFLSIILQLFHCLSIIPRFPTIYALFINCPTTTPKFVSYLSMICQLFVQYLLTTSQLVVNCLPTIPGKLNSTKLKTHPMIRYWQRPLELVHLWHSGHVTGWCKFRLPFMGIYFVSGRLPTGSWKLPALQLGAACPAAGTSIW